MNLSVVLLLIGMWIICCGMGYGLVYLLLPRHWRLERVLLLPVFGSALVIFLSSVLSYAGVGMRTAAPLVICAGAAISIWVHFWKSYDVISASDWRIAAYTNLLGLSAGFVALSSIVFYAAWDPYTDAFTYCSIADYLQHASYFRPADPDAYYPVLTQMLFYQRSGLRMGSNFLLGFFTALFRKEYSFDTYMPVLALGLWIAVPGLWVLCRRVLFVPIAATAIATALYALHVGIPITNALWGFLPQTWGIAFMLPMIALHVRATSRTGRLNRLIGAGVLGGMTLLFYTEIIPFALLAIASCYLVRLAFGRLRFFICLVSGVGPVLISVITAPIAAWNFVKVIAAQMSAVVGWDPKLRAMDYLLMLAGFRPGLVNGLLPITIAAHPSLEYVALVVAILVFLCVVYGCFFGPVRIRRQIACLSCHLPAVTRLVFVLCSQSLESRRARESVEHIQDHYLRFLSVRCDVGRWYC